MDRTFVLAMSRFVPYPMRSSFSAINISCDVTLSVSVRLHFVYFWSKCSFTSI